MLKNTTNTYGSVIKFLHWIMALLFVAMFALAYTMTNLAASDLKFTLYDLHKATGLLLFGFFTFRLIWRLFNVQPELPVALPNWQKRAAKINIAGLYTIMFCMPLTGFFLSMYAGYGISFYGLFHIAPFTKNPHLQDFFAASHNYISYLIIGLVSLHVLGALQHYWIRHDGILQRMLPSKRNNKEY